MHNLSRVAGYLVGYSKYVVAVVPFSCSVGHRIGKVAPKVEKQKRKRKFCRLSWQSTIQWFRESQGTSRDFDFSQVAERSVNHSRAWLTR